MELKVKARWMEGGQMVTMTDPFSKIVEARNYDKLSAVTDDGKFIIYPKVDFKDFALDIDSFGNKIYKELAIEMWSYKPNMLKLIFFTGAIHALRWAFDYGVPEIELAFHKIANKYGKEEEQCLLKPFTQQSNSTL